MRHTARQHSTREERDETLGTSINNADGDKGIEITLRRLKKVEMKE